MYITILGLHTSNIVDIYKMGLGNNTNIFPIVIQEFPIPDISPDDQHVIVNEIQSEIAKQDDIQNQISELRSQIDDIIIETISA
jgi:type I restriction enzyme S subunit